jgi:membrane protein implicated in regulation of membrane protease activity
VVYTLDILAWDWFYGLSMLFAALVFKGGRLQTAVRIAMAVSGVLSIAGLIFLPFGNIQLRIIGILGYAGLSPVVFLLLAKVLGRAESRSQEAARSLGPELGQNLGRENPQEVFKEDSFKEMHTM